MYNKTSTNSKTITACQPLSPGLHIEYIEKPYQDSSRVEIYVVIDGTDDMDFVGHFTKPRLIDGPFSSCPMSTYWLYDQNGQQNLDFMNPGDLFGYVKRTLEFCGSLIIVD